MTAAERLKQQALALGFDAAGIARVEPIEAQRHYEAWLAAGHHGGMDWLASDKHRGRRADPSRLLRDLRSVLCVALCYSPSRNEALDARVGRIARYAAGEDYHRIMQDKLGALERWVRGELFPGSHALWYSDTGAILERGWAECAGIGWVGKHAGVLSETLGSWFVLGEVLLDRDVDADAPVERERCGTCTRCIEACPTGAIVEPYRVDARRCISYLTIELRGPIPRELRPLVGDWVFGCDVCQDVCPWNRFAPPAREARLHARTLDGWTLVRFLSLDDAAFGQLFAGSPIRRARREGFLRNVCVALGNRREADATGALLDCLARERSALVRAHAAWALGEIARSGGDSARDAGIVAALAQAAAHDRSAEVREEAAFALRPAAPGQSAAAAPGAPPSGVPGTHSAPPSA